MKRSVGIITFHASHNYGSMLQAYALQQTLLKMGFDCEIINFRTQRQKDFYKPIFWRGSFLGKIKRTLFYLPFCLPLIKKYQLFEKFLREELILSDKEYTLLTEIDWVDFKYDYYISGSDQIWNHCCFDFDWAYFLPFVKDGKGKRIAYAPSMGPRPEMAGFQHHISLIKFLLNKYDAVSVREKSSALWLNHNVGKNYPVMLDPTLLLTFEEWNNKVIHKSLIKGKYIFFYTPRCESYTFEYADLLSKKLNIPIVVSLFYPGWKNNKWAIKSNVRLHLNTGPNEFLNLCKNATFIIGQSFHLVVFSIIFQKPFYIIKGMQDERVVEILSLTGLEDRSINTLDSLNNVSFHVDFEKAKFHIENTRKICLEWLKSQFSSQ